MNRNVAERKDVAKRFDEASATVTYIGEATVGTLDSEAGWRIKRFTVSGTETLLEWASGTPDYDKIWDNRASYTYS